MALTTKQNRDNQFLEIAQVNRRNIKQLCADPTELSTVMHTKFTLSAIEGNCDGQYEQEPSNPGMQSL